MGGGGPLPHTALDDHEAQRQSAPRPRRLRVGTRSDGEASRSLIGSGETGRAPAPNSGAPRIAVVLPGGGARGAFEAGALSVLLGALEARGERISIVCGTSVGAINAALLGSIAGLPAADQAAAMLARWRSMRKGDVIAPLVGPHAPLTLLRAVGELLELPGLRLTGLMDPAPLRASLERWIDWSALHANVRRRTVDTVCVVATSLDRGGPVAFVETRGPLPRSSDEIRYLPVTLATEHVRASAAIPFLFPPVRVSRPRAAAGDYVDGGTRMNAPLAPAVALGAERVIVIGFEPLGAPPPRAVASHTPHLTDVAANVLDGLLVDQVAVDVRRMLAINSFFVEGTANGMAPGARAYRRARGHQPYRRISHVLVAPPRRGALGEIAEEVLRERYGGLRGLRSPDFLVLSRLLGGGRARSRGELLSFLLFDEAYVEALIAAGQEAAQAWVDATPGLWREHAEDVAGFAHDDTERAEESALDEFRALRRR